MRSKLAFGALTLCVFLFSATFVQASGVVTFQIEVLPGVSISSPDNLVFDPVAPGQRVEQDVGVTVWSNVEWELAAQVIDYGAGDLQGLIEVLDPQGLWRELSTTARTLMVNRPVTGAEGLEVQIPFRVTGSYDLPGSYSFQVEFTVVPSL